MDYAETKNFLENVSNHSKEEILSNMQYIRDFFREYVFWTIKKSYVEEICKKVDKPTFFHELFSDCEKFKWWKEKLDIPDKLKFGVEIEVASIPIEKLEETFETGDIIDILRALDVPEEIIEKITLNYVFEKKNETKRWMFTKERSEESEASSPILKNNILDLNQIVAICTFFKSYGAWLHGGTGLHINIGVDYFECNEQAVKNLLLIWKECEEILYKIANPEGETMRNCADVMVLPIKNNIQKFLKEDGSVTLKSEEDLDRFVYQLQARDRMNKILANESSELEDKLRYTQSEEDKFKIYRRYEAVKRRGINHNTKVRFTSINFNHMGWSEDNPGRVEIRLFNSTLDPEIIFQDLTLVGKIFEVSLKNAKDSNYKKEEFEQLKKHDVSEVKKLDNFLKLLFDKAEQRDIFKRRWKSVKDKKDEYKRFISGEDTFER